MAKNRKQPRPLSLRQVLEHFEGRTDLARKLGLTPAATHFWKTGVPAAHVLKVEKLTGGRLTRYAMRPDIFGAEPR